MNLVVCDVDEVVLHYFCYLRKRLDPERYALEPDGRDLKIKDILTGNWLEQGHSDLISDEVLMEVIEEQAAISGAVESLQRLADGIRVIFLTNIREHLIEPRKDCLARHGLPFQIVMNVGGKGQSVKKLFRELQPESVIVIDDSVRQLLNIRKHVPHAHLIRAALTPETRLIESDDQFLQAYSWSEILEYIATLHN